MKLDPTKMKDWQIAEAAEATLRPAADLLGELGINDDEWDAYGRYLAKVDVTKVLRRLGGGDASKAPKRAKYSIMSCLASDCSMRSCFDRPKAERPYTRP